MEKKTFEMPEVMVVTFEEADILTLSTAATNGFKEYTW